MAEQLEQITARLAGPSAGRTEADLQADVRALLLGAALDLEPDELLEVKLEAQAGGGRRIDVEAGCAAIECKRSLASPKVVDAAVDQLAGYVRQRTDELGQRYVGLLTDGKDWQLYHLQPDDRLEQAAGFRLTRAADAPQLVAWLDGVLATRPQLHPTPGEIVAQLGAGSPGFALDLADLEALYAAARNDAEVQLKRELWARLLAAALGTNFEASDELFVLHTYLVLTAELLAHAVARFPLEAAEDDVRGLLAGHQFDRAGLHGVVEADFFDWPALVPHGAPIVRGIARRLARFDWSQVEHDVLKQLYESVIDADTRRRLGEYYTPDWLAQHMVDETFERPLEQRLLDPACGSGTFLFWAARRFLTAADEAGLSNREALNRLVGSVSGIDLHPVAVTLARVTYLLAIGHDRLAEHDELTVPVYLGDSVRWEQDHTLLSQGGITVHTSDGMELFAQDLHFPEGIVDDPARFDRLVGTLANRAAERTTTAVPGIKGILDGNRVAEADREAVTAVFAKLCRLHDAGRDHIWGYYIRNLARPLAFARPDGRADVLVGNPPWLAFRHMPESLQIAYSELAKARGLWAGGKVATHQDLSDLFVARAVEQYLAPGGRFSFVVPYALLSRRQYAGFRSGDWSSQAGGEVTARFDRAEEFARVKPPLFPVPSAVVSGRRSSPVTQLSNHVLSWTGRVSTHHLDWAAALPALHSAEVEVTLAADVEDSPYRERFSQGANFVPRVLVTAVPASAGPLGVAYGQTAVASARSANEKQPWRSLPSLEGAVEEQFVRPLHLGATIVAHRPRDPLLAILPWVDGELLNADHERLDEFPGLARWWREAERLWEKHKGKNPLSLGAQIDYQSKLRRQFPVPPPACGLRRVGPAPRRLSSRGSRVSGRARPLLDRRRLA